MGGYDRRPSDPIAPEQREAFTDGAEPRGLLITLLLALP
jgi:hypothetical protein